MKRAKESAAEIVNDSKEILKENGLLAERSEYPEPIAEVEASSLSEIVKDVQQRIDIDNNFEDLVSEPEEVPSLPAFEVDSEIEEQIISNAAMDVSAVVDSIVGDEGFVTVDDSFIDEEAKADGIEFADLPDFDSLIETYKAVRLQTETVADTAAAEEVLAAEQPTKVDDLAEDVATEIEEIAEEEAIEFDEPVIEEDASDLYADDFESLDDEIVADEETDQQEEIEEDLVAETVIEPAFTEKESVAEIVSDVTAEEVVDADEVFAEDDGEWMDFSDLEDIGDFGFNEIEDDAQEEIAESAPAEEEPAEEDPAEEYIAPIHEDYVREDAVFTDYDDSLRMFEDISDAPAQKQETAESDDFDMGFEIDFSVFEDSPKNRTAEPVAETKPEKGGFFRRIKKK